MRRPTTRRSLAIGLLGTLSATLLACSPAGGADADVAASATASASSSTRTSTPTPTPTLTPTPEPSDIEVGRLEGTMTVASGVYTGYQLEYSVVMYGMDPDVISVTDATAIDKSLIEGVSNFTFAIRNKTEGDRALPVASTQFQLGVSAIYPAGSVLCGGEGPCLEGHGDIPVTAIGTADVASSTLYTLTGGGGRGEIRYQPSFLTGIPDDQIEAARAEMLSPSGYALVIFQTISSSYDFSETLCTVGQSSKVLAQTGDVSVCDA